MLGQAMSKLRDMFGSNEPPERGVFSEDLANFVNAEYQRRQTERRAFEIQWRLNLEFLNGNQYLEINPTTMAIEEVAKPFFWTEREVFNQISTITETRISRLTRQKPILKTRPASVDQSDQSAAKISSMLLQSAWHEQEIDVAYNDLYIPWLEVTGTCFFKVTWNKKKGRKIYEGPDPNMMPGQSEDLPTLEGDQAEDSKPLFTQEPKIVTLYEGDIETSVVPPHEIYPDSSWRDDVQYCKSIIHARAYHIDDIKDMWGVSVESEEVDAITLQSINSGLGGLGYASGSFRSSSKKLKDHAIVKEYYERPSARYPQGRFIVVAGDKTLFAGVLPYQIGRNMELELPFIRTCAVKRVGCLWGTSIIERCIPIQRRYNAVRNRKAEYLNLVAIGQWYEPEGSLDDDAELNNAPGNRIRYRMSPNGAKPEPVSFPSLPASFENEISTLLSEFTSVSGVSELSRYSEAPAGVKSGVALSIANEQDDTRNGLTAAHIANAVTTLGKYWLRMYRQFAQEPRIMRGVGLARMAEVREWSASDLTSDDVIIENASALAETPSQRRQMVFDLLNAGLFNKPEASNLTDEARQKIFTLLEYGHWETGWDDDTQLQRSRAMRENRRMVDMGEMAQVMDYDNHDLHIQQHNIMRLQADYEELLRTPQGQMIDQMMQQHIQEHQYWVQMQQMQMMQQQAAQAMPPQ